MKETVKLYQQDAYRTHFTSPVLEAGEEKGRPYVILEETCFYPESGGQPADRGWFNNVAVTDVQIRGGIIYHFLERPIRDDVVTGSIDWHRRYDFMQQHTGQHMISRALEEVANARTVSVHLGEEYTSIELDVRNVSEDGINKAVELANRVIREKRQVRIHFVSPEEAGKLNLRKPPPEVKVVRIVEIEGFDYSPCGGTHVATTSEVGLIQVVGQEKIRGHVRLFFQIGDRALRDYREKVRLIRDLSRELTSGETELLPRIRDMKYQMKQLHKQMARLRGELAQYQASRALEHAETVGPYQLVSHVYREMVPEVLKAFADEALRQPGVVVAVFATDGVQLRWLLARSDDVPLNLAELTTDLLHLIQARGGGSPQRIQGGGNNPEGINQFLQRFKEKMLQEQGS